MFSGFINLLHNICVNDFSVGGGKAYKRWILPSTIYSLWGPAKFLSICHDTEATVRTGCSIEVTICEEQDSHCKSKILR